MFQNKVLIKTESLPRKFPRGNITSFSVFKKLTCVNRNDCVVESQKKQKTTTKTTAKNIF